MKKYSGACCVLETPSFTIVAVTFEINTNFTLLGVSFFKPKREKERTKKSRIAAAAAV